MGHFQDKVLRIDEIDGTAVDILGLAISAQDATAFTPVPPGVFSARVPALGSINVTLRFEPTAARRFGDAEFTPFTASNAIGFPVVLRGNGVFQKRIIHLRIDAADHPPSQPLDFGTLQIGQSTNRTFTVRNTTKSSLSVTLIWVSCDPPFCDRPGPNTLIIPGNSKAGISLRFRPRWPGQFHAIVELRAATGPAGAALTSFAGIVLTGKGVAASAIVSGGTIAPATIDPGGAITLRYTLRHPKNWAEVATAQLEGLPSNTPGGSTMQVPLPASNGAQVTQRITIGPPAMDGVYPLTLRILHRTAGDTVFPLGNLTVRDIAATIDNVVIRTDNHSRTQCELPLVARSLEYRVHDNNGATDVYSPRIDDIQPPENEPSKLLISTTPPIPLASPSNPDVTTETVTSTVDLNCAARARTWTLIVRIDEDDKTATPSTRQLRIRKLLSYKVYP